MHGTTASHTVRTYLDAMEARDLDRARAMQAPGFWMQFPGGWRFTDLSELIAWAKTRYKTCAKRYERFDEAAAGEDTVVYCYGTLFGIGNDGRPFEGIRFIDRFTVRNGRLVDQMVWNDLAETFGRSPAP